MKSVGVAKVVALCMCLVGGGESCLKEDRECDPYGENKCCQDPKTLVCAMMGTTFTCQECIAKNGTCKYSGGNPCCEALECTYVPLEGKDQCMGKED